MNKLGEFYLDLFWAKQKWLAIQSNLEKRVFDIETENRISAISNLFNFNFDAMPYVMASKKHFKDTSIDKILEIIIEASKSNLTDIRSFEFYLFNRLNINSN